MRTFLILFFAVFSMSALAAIYEMPSTGNDIIGQILNVQIQEGDTINKLAQKYEVSYHELLEANPGINPRLLQVGKLLIIPTEYILPKYREGIVINTAEPRLYYFYPDGKYVFTTPVGLGRYNWRTPEMATKVIKKVEDPTWHIPKAIREHALKTTGKELPDEIPPGPDNPLGKYAIYLARNGYLIHGTNNPESVGKYYSSGCIRLYEHAIATLFAVTSIGTDVHVIHSPNKVGYLHGELYLESHEPVGGIDHILDIQQQNEAEGDVQNAITNNYTYIDWYKVYLVAQKRLGIPISVGKDLYNNQEE